MFKNKRLALGILSVLVILTLALAGCGGGSGTDKAGNNTGQGNQETIVIRLSHSGSPTSTWELGARKWAELVEEASNGRIKIQTYPAGQLTGGSQETEMSMLQSGDIQATMTSTIWYTSLVPEMTVFQMPFLFKDEAQADKILDGKLGQEMLDLLKAKNIVGLAYGENGFRQLTNNVREVKTPEDLKGLKIRIPGIQLYASIFKALGADPTVMTWGEAFTALQQGTIDGQENPIVGMIIPNRLYEVQKYITLWNYSYDAIVLGVSKVFWDSLDAETQEILRSTAQKAMKYQRELNRSEIEGKDPVQYLKDKGMVVTTLTDEARKEFQELMKPVYEQYESVIGKELLDKFLAATSD